MTRRQLLALGLKPSAITLRLQTGRLHRVHFGVYAVGHPPTTALQKAAAAVLACGPGAALSHWSALTLWGLERRWRFPAHVTSETDRRHPGIVNHRAPLAREDTAIQLGIRATRVPRTLLDLARRLPERRLVRLIADARRAGLASERQLAAVVQRHPHHAGAATVAALLGDPATSTRSDFEVDFLAFCERHGLPRPRINAPVNGHEVDALFEEQRLIVECDGWEFHRDRHSFESDRERDTRMLAAGFQTVRVTRSRLGEDPDREAGWLRRILALRSG